MDSVFEDPSADIVIEVPKDIDYRDKFEKNEKIIVSGDFVMRAGGGIGWPDAPFRERPKQVAGAYGKATISFDARPDNTIRIFGKLKTEMDSDNGSDIWKVIEFDELYCDYNVVDKMFFRFGKFYLTWGQGRLFRPGNFCEDYEDGTTMRFTFPTVLDGISLVTHYNRHGLSSSDNTLHKGDLDFLGHIDKTFGPVNFSLAAFYNYDTGQRYLGSVKTNVLHTDLFGDYILNISDKKELSHQALVGFFREWTDAKLYGEYYYDGRIKGDEDHCFGMATDFKHLFGSSVSFGLKWLHAVNNEAGQFIGGFSISPWKHVTIRAAVPWCYGEKELDDDFYEGFPIKSKLAFTLFVELGSSF